MSPAVVEFMEDLATDVAKQRAFREAPEQYLASSRLSEQQRKAVLSGETEQVRSMMIEHTSNKEGKGDTLLIDFTSDEN